MNFVGLLKTMPGFIGSDGRSDETIVAAEKTLNTSFAQDYRAYLGEIGLACFDGHELTGLTRTIRLDVISVTQEYRKLSSKMTASWYVVEEVGMDGIVIWQSSDGTVYATAPNSKPKKIASSLSEYIIGR